MIHGPHACRCFGVWQFEGACPLGEIVSEYQDVLFTIRRGWQIREYIHGDDVKWGTCQHVLEPSSAAGRRALALGAHLTLLTPPDDVSIPGQ